MNAQGHSDSPDFFKQVFDTAACGIIVFEPVYDGKVITDLRYIAVNQAGEKILGRKTGELIGYTLLSLFPGHGPSGLFARFAHVAVTGEPDINEYFYSYDGYNSWFKTTTVKMGEMIVVTFDDITNRKQAESVIGTNDTLLATILNNAPIVVYTLDHQGVFLDVLGSGLRRSGKTGSMFIGKSITDIWPSITVEISRVLGGETRVFMVEAGTGDNKRYYLNHCFFDPITGIATGIAIDVSDQKATEEKLRKSRHFIERVANVTPGLITVFNCKTGRYIFVSKTLELLLGYPQENWLKQGFDVLTNLLHPDDRAGVIEKNQRSIEIANAHPEGFSDDAIVEFEYRMRHSNGEWRWLQTYGTIFDRAEDGTVEHIVNVSIDITQRKMAEEKLQTTQEELRVLNAQLEQTIRERTHELQVTEERFHLVSRATNDAVWDWNLLTDNVWWNHGFKTMFGYTDEQIEPGVQSWYTRIHPDDQERVVRGIHEVIDNGGTQWSDEYRFRRADGTYAIILDRGYALHDETGKPYRMLGSMLDLTSFRTVQEALRASETEYRTLVMASAQIVWITDPEGKVEDMPAWREFTGQTPEEVRGFGWLDAIHPDDRAHTRYVWEYCVTNRVVYETEYRLRKNDGSYRYFSARGVPILAPDGSVYKWLGTCSDIHEQKVAQEALRKSEERFQLASVVTRDTIWDRDLLSNTLTHTDGYNEIFGYTSYDPAPTVEEWYARIHPDDTHRVLTGIQKSLDGNEQFWSDEYRYQRRDGNYAYVYDRAYIVRDHEKPVRMVGAMTDISERKIAEEKLIRSESHLREAQRISHIGNWSYDLTTGRISWSEEVFHIFGIDPHNGEPDFEAMLVHFPEADVLQKYVETAISHGTPYQFDAPLLRRDGTLCYVQNIGTAIMNTEGICTGLYGTVMDITERKQAEEKIRQSRQQLQLITDALPALISYVDTERRYRFINEEYVKWFGEQARQLIGTKIEDVVGIRAYELVRPYLDRAFAGELVTYEIEMPYHQGNRHINAKYVPDIDDNGTVQGFVALVVDISNEVRAQEKIRMQALVLDNMNEGVCLIDEEGIILYTNPAEDSIFGYEPGELIGKHISVQAAYPAADSAQIFQDIFDRLRAEGSWSGEFHNVQKDGTPIITYTRITSLAMSGKPYWVCVQEDITEDKRAQHALEYQHRITHTITNNATAALFMIDAKGRCTFMNPAAETMTGYTFEEIKGRTLHEVIHYSHPDGTPYPIEDCPIDCVLPRNIQICAHEDVFIRKDGTFFPVMCSASPISENDTPIATVIEVRDITQEKETRERIRESEERLRAALTASGTGTFRWDIATNQLEWDQNLNRLFGLPPDLTAQTLDKFIAMAHPDDRAAIIHGCEKSAQEGVDFDMEFRVVWPDGTIHWLYDRGKVVSDEFGQPDYMTGACVDITDYKRDQEIIRESGERFRFLADNIPQIVWQADPNGDIVFYNRHWFNYTGIHFEETQYQKWEKVIHPDDIEENLKAWNHSIETGEQFEFEHRFRRHDGVYRWHLGRAQAMCDDSGNIIMWIGINVDIDDQKRFAEELEKRVQERTEELLVTNDELNRSNSELERFAYVASHDLQEPLRKITTFGERLSGNYADNLDKRGLMYLDSMRNAAARMQSLIDDLLTFSRITRNKEASETVELNVVLKEILIDLEIRIEQRNAIITVENLPVIGAVRSQMRQLFQNLISNALKFNDKEQPIITVTAETVYGREVEGISRAYFFDKYCRITVRDNGIGFEEQYLNKIFIIFQRLHNRSDYDGTGIGLAICQKIVESHHGFITAHSKPGEGSSFVVVLPFEQ